VSPADQGTCGAFLYRAAAFCVFLGFFLSIKYAGQHLQSRFKNASCFFWVLMVARPESGYGAV
jgi:hypothetical protein